MKKSAPKCCKQKDEESIVNNNTQESKIQLEYINKCTELVKENMQKAPAFLYPECRLPDEFPADGDSGRYRETYWL